MISESFFEPWKPSLVLPNVLSLFEPIWKQLLLYPNVWVTIEDVFLFNKLHWPSNHPPNPPAKKVGNDSNYTYRPTRKLNVLSDKQGKWTDEKHKLL